MEGLREGVASGLQGALLPPQGLATVLGDTDLKIISI